MTDKVQASLSSQVKNKFQADLKIWMSQCLGINVAFPPPLHVKVQCFLVVKFLALYDENTALVSVLWQTRGVRVREVERKRERERYNEGCRWWRSGEFMWRISSSIVWLFCHALFCWSGTVWRCFPPEDQLQGNHRKETEVKRERDKMS